MCGSITTPTPSSSRCWPMRLGAIPRYYNTTQTRLPRAKEVYTTQILFVKRVNRRGSPRAAGRSCTSILGAQNSSKAAQVRAKGPDYIFRLALPIRISSYHSKTRLRPVFAPGYFSPQGEVSSAVLISHSMYPHTPDRNLEGYLVGF